MLAITVNTLYTSLRKRGTTRQLTRAIVLCVLSVLLLLLAFIWYNLRFTVKQAGLSMLEVEAALAYVALSGWIFPQHLHRLLPRYAATALQRLDADCSPEVERIPQQNRRLAAPTLS